MDGRWFRFRWLLLPALLVLIAGCGQAKAPLVASKEPLVSQPDAVDDPGASAEAESGAEATPEAMSEMSAPPPDSPPDPDVQMAPMIDRPGEEPSSVLPDKHAPAEEGPLSELPMRSGPSALPPFPAGSPVRSSPPVVDKGFTRLRVFYATDRLRGGAEPNDFYSDQRRAEDGEPKFELGQCDVAIPYKHAPGEVERPSMWKLEFREDPAKHVVLLNVQPTPSSTWQEQVRENIAESDERAAMVFVHGFNVDFASAARRTAQMKYDLGFRGAAIMFSWPAPSNYVECEGNAIWTLPHLMEFLTDYVQQSGAKRIHLIAHSMGTRVLATALKELAASSAAAPVRYDQIILAAPDIDAAVFKTQIAPRIAAAAERISIYSSSNDLALVASKKAHHYKRLGEGGPNLTTFPEWPQIEVLDATSVDESLLGHSYYGNSPTILRDVRGVLAGLGAAARGLKAQANYYLFRPKRSTLSEPRPE